MRNVGTVLGLVLVLLWGVAPGEEPRSETGPVVERDGAMAGPYYDPFGLRAGPWLDPFGLRAEPQVDLCE